ncbi:non-homologous end joining protein Ku [Paenibacillus alkalitolerans]|uniref:non-homologous end joining protein Ku n=1 Tax=Paenibacillus alkalitolerans TaxID=2799335 RepID=UPI0018F56578|nr:Ku protein [Paenibacillus alkalitolerans]
MHTIWKGAISFGLVNIPVKMYAATEDKDISMRMLHRDCGTPISYSRRCPNCEMPVENEAIVKGFEYEKGRFVRFEKDELDALAADASREIKILDFVDLEEIDPIYFQKTYYLGPGDTGANAYGLLQQALKDTGKIGIARVTIRNKSSLAAIRIVGNCISMETIFYPDEIRPAAQVPNLQTTMNVSDKELTMAKMLIEQLSVPFEPEKYHDEYREQVMELIEKKIAGEEIEIAPEPRRTNVIDLMAALQASLEAAKDKSPDVAAATDRGAAGAGAPGAGAGAGAAKPKRTRRKAAGAEDDAKDGAGKEPARRR